MSFLLLLVLVYYYLITFLPYSAYTVLQCVKESEIIMLLLLLASYSN